MYELFFNSAAFFFITLPVLIFISAWMLKRFIKNKLLVLSIISIVQVLLYYGYSCIKCGMKITEVYLDYVQGIIIYTLIFGYLGIVFSNFIRKRFGN
ncbi:hypothetical protein [Clostridium lundense]|uniref:hypothetical protein n=1 Tax=Clostridium lundense TaxID=319475 RepID=UPI000481C1F7|nr:hypothetical protein [Clostridium lundense]